jgi:hypothetical protein
MTRMTRELSLVLIGATALTTGYFFWPEPDFEKRTEEQAGRRVGGATAVHPLVWLRTPNNPGGKSPAVAGVSRGGFGSIGGRLSGGRFSGVRAVGRVGA